MANFKLKAGFFAGSVLTGAASGFLRGTPGHRKDFAREDALVAGAGVGAVLLSPRIAKVSVKAMRSGFAKGSKSAKAQGKVIFRRVRGRVIAIRKK